MLREKRALRLGVKAGLHMGVTAGLGRAVPFLPCPQVKERRACVAMMSLLFLKMSRYAKMLSCEGVGSFCGRVCGGGNEELCASGELRNAGTIGRFFFFFLVPVGKVSSAQCWSRHAACVSWACPRCVTCTIRTRVEKRRLSFFFCFVL